jgi:hypothetical protein
MGVIMRRSDLRDLELACDDTRRRAAIVQMRDSVCITGLPADDGPAEVTIPVPEILRAVQLLQAARRDGWAMTLAYQHSLAMGVISRLATDGIPPLAGSLADLANHAEQLVAIREQLGRL